MFEALILWKLFDIENRRDLDEPEDISPFWYFAVLSLIVLWPVALFFALRQRGDNWYMALSPAVGLACFGIVFPYLWFGAGVAMMLYAIYVLKRIYENS